jgi:hypothetical protein
MALPQSEATAEELLAGLPHRLQQQSPSLMA